MANQTYPRGMVPVPKNGEAPNTTSYPKSTSSVLALWKYSPVYVTSGQVRSVVVGHVSAAANGVTGTVECLLDSTGAVVDTLAAGDAGTVIMTNDPDQVYRMCVDDTDYEDSMAGNTYYDFTAETSTQETFSGIKLDGSTGTTTSTDGVVLAGKRVPHVGTINAAQLANTEIYCTINPTFFVAAP